ncbi:MAG: ABC transporter permease [Aeromicrobium sp.]|uniref:ABC transporter permease n=1 Tax=Aeromicrobium sp. TaxID=1871063 RepID=UPI00262528D3|nr:ABC transporter permease [Aeromicrobium sp.]MDF1706174.1 ABC transporter permease [Aeromicrobium sp.]
MSVVSESWDWLTDPAQWEGPAGIPHRTLQHLEYTGLTLAIAAVIAIPLGLYIGHTGRFRGLAVASTGALRALPTLGVLTLVSLHSGIDLTAALVALVLLAIPSLLAGAYAGLESVDPATVDAARAVGMTHWQVLWRVEVPLALPLLIGGFRTATLQVIATATIAAFVPGPGGLGVYLLTGLAVGDFTRIVGGSVVVIVLALVVDLLFAAAQRLSTRRRVSTPERV